MQIKVGISKLQTKLPKSTKHGRFLQSFPSVSVLSKAASIYLPVFLFEFFSLNLGNLTKVLKPRIETEGEKWKEIWQSAKIGLWGARGLSFTLRYVELFQTYIMAKEFKMEKWLVNQQLNFKTSCAEYNCYNWLDRTPIFQKKSTLRRARDFVSTRIAVFQFCSNATKCWSIFSRFENRFEIWWHSKRL